MDKISDNKATPTKRTGVKDANNYENLKDTEKSISPEINQPEPSTIPSIPEEVPVREFK